MRTFEQLKKYIKEEELDNKSKVINLPTGIYKGLTWKEVGIISLMDEVVTEVSDSLESGSMSAAVYDGLPRNEEKPLRLKVIKEAVEQLCLRDRFKNYKAVVYYTSHIFGASASVLSNDRINIKIVTVEESKSYWFRLKIFLHRFH